MFYCHLRFLPTTALLLVLTFLFSSSICAKTVSGDEAYKKLKTSTGLFIYPQDYRPWAQKLIGESQKIHSLYQNEYQWQLDEKPTIVLTSPRNQVANGYATLFPMLKTVFYGGGAEMLDEFATLSWARVLLHHEFAHLYQLNAKESYSSTLKSILGNSSTNFLIPFTYMITPNIFLPTFMLEGNAVFNEGRFLNGGRLYNSDNKALLLSLIRANKINSKRLINDNLFWPFTSEKYLIGGFFNLYLAEKYGIETTNSFFKKNARYVINPLQLKRAFNDTFGIGYDQAVEDFVSSHKSVAQEVVALSEPALARTFFHRGLNRHNNRVIFLTTDARTLPVLYSIEPNETSYKIRRKKLNIPFGKPLILNKEVYVSSSEVTEYNAIRYGLFASGFKIWPSSANQMTYDTYQNRRLFADTKSSFYEVELFERDENTKTQKSWGVIHSTAHYSPNGDVLFFRQAGNKRVFYKNGIELFSYEGYFGKIADSTPSGDIYFIAPSERGSTLYHYKSSTGDLVRAHPADTLFDARKLDERRWVFVEITAHGYEFKVVENLEANTNSDSSLSNKTKPHVIQHFYESMTSQAPTVADSKDESLKEDIFKDEKNYSSLRDMQWNGFDPFFLGYTNYGAIAGLSSRWSDPLEYNSVLLSYSHLEGATNDVLLAWSNRRHRLQWTLAGELDQEALFEAQKNKKDEDKVVARYETYRGLLQFDYPLWIRPQITSQLTTRYTYEYDESKDKNIKLDREQSVLTFFNLQKRRAYPISYSLNSLDQLILAHEALGDIPQWQGDRMRYSAIVYSQRDILRETYLSGRFQAVRSDSPAADIEINDVSPGGLGSSKLFLKPTELSRFTRDTATEFFEAHKVTFELKQAINTGLYFRVFPLSLRRWAPFANYQEFYGRTNKYSRSLDTLFHEWTYGAEFELLFLHRFPVRLTLANSEMNKKEGSTFTSFLNFEKLF